MKEKRNIFNNDHLKLDLKKKSLKGGALAITSQVIIFFLQIFSTMILARILSPDDYGIVAMAVAITGFANIFIYMGLSTATIQRAEINHEQVSLLFWINAALGFLICILLMVLSPLIAWFYDRQELVDVFLLQSVVFIIVGLSIQHSAILTRQMRFYTLAKIKIFSSLAGFTVAIVLANLNFGYWSLVFHSLTNASLNTIFLWICSKWIPGLPKKNIEIKPLVNFGLDLVFFNIIVYFSQSLDKILIGKYFGSAPLGFYSKAYQLLMVPIINLRDPIASVALPALSRLQDDDTSFGQFYLKYVSLLSFITMPLVSLMFICSDQIIYIVLGPQWSESAIIFKILCIAAFIHPTSSTCGMVLLASGKSRTYLKLGIAQSIVICFSFLCALPWGVNGIAIAYTVSIYVFLIPQLYFSFLGTTINIIKFMKAIYKQLFFSVVISFTCSYFIVFFNNINLFSNILISCFLSACIYLILFLLLKEGRQDLKNYYDYVFIILKKS